MGGLITNITTKNGITNITSNLPDLKEAQNVYPIRDDSPFLEYTSDYFLDLKAMNDIYKKEDDFEDIFGLNDDDPTEEPTVVADEDEYVYNYD